VFTESGLAPRHRSRPAPSATRPSKPVVGVRRKVVDDFSVGSTSSCGYLPCKEHWKLSPPTWAPRGSNQVQVRAQFGELARKTNLRAIPAPHSGRGIRFTRAEVISALLADRDSEIVDVDVGECILPPSTARTAYFPCIRREAEYPTYMAEGPGPPTVASIRRVTRAVQTRIGIHRPRVRTPIAPSLAAENAAIEVARCGPACSATGTCDQSHPGRTFRVELAAIISGPSATKRSRFGGRIRRATVGAFRTFRGAPPSCEAR
jgi:hypothetical protein